MDERQDHIRIGTSEREEAIEELSRQFSAGRLDPDEFMQRSTAISRALTQGDLRPVFADLPVILPLSAHWAEKLERIDKAKSDVVAAQRVRAAQHRYMAVVWSRSRACTQIAAGVCAVLAMAAWYNTANLIATTLLIVAVVLLAASRISAATEHRHKRKS